jgi:hypothetical protein
MTASPVHDSQPPAPPILADWLPAASGLVQTADPQVSAPAPSNSAAPPVPAAAGSRPPLLWGDVALGAAARAETRWLWHGYVAEGAVTLLVSRWKSGKTTLASVLLARLRTGGEFAGLPLATARAVVVSEESPDHWYRRSRTLSFGDHVGWFCQPFRGKPRPEQWLDLIDRLAELRAQRDVRLVVIDPLAALTPGRGENNAASILEVLLPLQRLTAVGQSVLVLHHPKKGESIPGEAARGSGALAGYADILIEMHRNPRAADDDRRRRLHAFSRFPETPRQRVIELTPDGADYVSLGSFREEEFSAFWQGLSAVLENASCKLTRADILERWNSDSVPDSVTLYRRLERSVLDGTVKKDGQGTRKSPFRYWLPSQEARWLQDPVALLRMPELAYPYLRDS